MFTMNKIVRALARHFEATAIARVNGVLLGMDRKTLAKGGISYDKLRQGVSAWPWRELPQDSALQAYDRASGNNLPTLIEGSVEPATVDHRKVAIAIHSETNGRDAA